MQAFCKLAFLLFVITFARAEEITTPVMISQAQLGEPNEKIPLSGSVTSIRKSSISPKLAGYIETMQVDIGDVVNKGDPLIYLDRQLVEIEISRVQALIAEAETRGKELQRQSDEAAELVTKKHIASTSHEAARAEVEINAAVIQRLKTQLKSQRALLKRHTVYAPFNGVITNKLVEVGQWVDTGDPLFELTELEQLRVEVQVPQFYYSRVNVGTAVIIKFDAIPEQEFAAQVSIKVPNSQQTTRTFPVLININNEDKQIAPGMSARVSLQLTKNTDKKIVFVPRDAIVRKPDGSETVWVVANNQGEDRVKAVDVKTGNSFQGQIEIRAGDISAGDQIVIKGNELLQPNQIVNITNKTELAL